MNEVQKLAHKVLQRQEESVRFSVTLTKTDNSRLEKLAELMGRSKSAFCGELIAAALNDMEEVIDMPDSNTNASLPSAKEYAEAFSGIREKLTEGHRAMLTAHCHTSDYTTTTSELAKAAGYGHFGAVNLQYARLGTMLADYLNWSLPKHSDGSPFPTALLVKWSFEDVWYCTLHPQVTKALKIAGLVED
ncbi:MAG: hypothetical protein HC895_17960 [Leptolyngbyaceae cyanobacterium SM1_3_5]|nr:hypothetical protein [Leptolyngbyaceae cyanobacterium SM1_3_5]